MRTRTRNTVDDSLVLNGTTFISPHHYCGGGVVNAVFGISPSVTPVEWTNESISDSLGHGKVNPVVHYKHYVKITPKDAYVSYYNPGAGANILNQGPGPWGMTSVDYYRGLHQGWNLAVPSSMPSGFTVDNSLVDEPDMVASVIENAKQLKADVLLNIIEANQIWPAVQTFARTIPAMGRSWSDLRGLIRSASGAFLAYKFGVSPIISDMMAIQRYLPRLKQDVIRHGNQQASRFSIVAELPCQYTPPTPGSAPRLEGSGRVFKAPTIRYVLVVKPKTKYHTSFFKKADAFLSRFATSPASLAWEKVPFSFVVDWFVDLRGALNGLDKLIGSEPYEIVGFSRSYGFHLQAEIAYTNPNGCVGGDLWTSSQAQSEYKYYERQPVSGQQIMPAWRPRFGKSQAGITAALISQQLSKLH